MNQPFDKVTEIIECESITTQLRSNSAFSFRKKGYVRLIRDYSRRSYVLEFFPYIKDRAPIAQNPCITLNISKTELQGGRVQYKNGSRTAILLTSDGVCYIEIANETISKNFQEKMFKCLEDPNLIDDSIIIFNNKDNGAFKKPKISNFEIKVEPIKITKDNILLDMYKTEQAPVKKELPVKIETKPELKQIIKEPIIINTNEPSIFAKKFYSSSSNEKAKDLNSNLLNDLENLEEEIKKPSLTPKISIKRRRDELGHEDEIEKKDKVFTPKRNGNNQNVKFVRNTTPSSNTRAMKRLNMTPSNQENQENDFNFDDDLLKSPVKTWNRNNSRTFLKGFSNLGNTCYMNSILQCLLNIDIFALELIKNYDIIKRLQLPTILDTKSDLNEDQILLLETEQNYLYNCLCELVKARESHNEDLKVKSLRDIKNTISKEATRFSGYQQHDAHEFLCQILDQLKDEANKLGKNQREKNIDISNPVVDNFEFQVTHVIECKNCGNTIINYEEYNNLCLELPESFQNSTDDQKMLSIQDALEIFFKDELLTDFKCEKCDTIGENLIRRKIVRLPRILILHLKRYQFKEVIETKNLVSNKDEIDLDEPTPIESETKIISYKLVKNESSILIPKHLNLTHLLTSKKEDLKQPIPVDKDIMEQSLKIDDRPQSITPLKSSQKSSNGIETRSKANNTPTNRPALGKLSVNSPSVKPLNFDSEANKFLTPNAKPRRPLSTLKANSVGKNTKFLDGTYDFDEEIKNSHNPRMDLSKKFDEETQKAMKLSLATYKAENQFDIDEKDDYLPDLIEDPFSDEEIKVKPSKEFKQLIDLSKPNENSYQVIGIVNHLGSSSNSGHYISDVLNLRTKRWSSFDDSQVESLKEEDVFTSRVKTGYIFFYIHNSLVKE